MVTSILSPERESRRDTNVGRDRDMRRNTTWSSRDVKVGLSRDFRGYSTTLSLLHSLQVWLGIRVPNWAWTLEMGEDVPSGFGPETLSCATLIRGILGLQTACCEDSPVMLPVTKTSTIPGRMMSFHIAPRVLYLVPLSMC